MKTWCFALAALTAITGEPARAQAIDPVPLNGRWELVLTADGQSERTVRLSVELLAPSGRTHRVDGFWDGGSTWRIRFLVDEEGDWRFRAESTPPVAGLDAIAGSFQCRRGDASPRFAAHGAVRVADGGHHLVHNDGTPFFWLVDTAWNGALLSTEEEWRRFLDDRAGKRFTGVKFVAAAPWRAGYANAEGETAYDGFDDIEIRPEFFRRIDARIDELNARGLLAVPVLLWALGRPEHSPGQLPEAQAIRLARYMVARWQGNHVVWILAGDGNYSGEHAERWRRIGRAVFDDAGHAPAMLHPGGMRWPHDAFLAERWVNILGYQSGHGDSDAALRWIVEGPHSGAWQREPIRPLINLEPPYEDHVAYESRQPHTARSVRRAAWWSVLSVPTAGVSYGAHGVWSWEREPAVPLNHAGSGIARPWHEAMALPGSDQMGHLAELMASLDFWRLRPDPELVRQPGAVAAALEPAHLAYTRDGDGRAVFFVNGVAVSETVVGGSTENWDAGFHLALANELTGDRPWRGTLHRVAVYGRALAAAEIAGNHASGVNTSGEGLLVLYTFAEGRGTMVRDLAAAGEALDLSISDSTAVRWLADGGLAVERQVTISSAVPASVLTAAVQASGAITIEVWAAPADAVQAGPARIVTLSRDINARNFTLGQDGVSFLTRLRTSATSNNGEPALSTAGPASAHIAAARSAAGDLAVIYSPGGGEIVIDPTRLETGLTAAWFDPRTGERFAAEATGSSVYRTPSELDWVLVFSPR